MPCDLATIQAAACTSGIGKEQSKIKLLQLIAQLTCEASEGGGGGAVWGDITGTLSDQTDLQTALDAKLTAASNLADVASAETSRANLGILYLSSAVADSVSGTSTWEDLITFTVPANSMGANGFLRVTSVWSLTNNANSKFVRILFGGGDVWLAQVINVSTVQICCILSNRNATNAQFRMPQSTTAAISGTSTAAVAANLAIDTTVNQTVSIQGWKVDAGDTVTAQAAIVEVVRRN
jgi:hypothetical protein